MTKLGYHINDNIEARYIVKEVETFDIAKYLTINEAKKDINYFNEFDKKLGTYRKGKYQIYDRKTKELIKYEN